MAGFELKVAPLVLAAFATVALAGPAQSGGRIATDFDQASFSDPTNIDNPYWPLVPGTTFIYAAEGVDECEVDIFEVSDQTKTVAGVEALVIFDTAYIDEDCDGSGDIRAEITQDWHAQDDDGNIWYLGEDTKSCDETGTVCEDPAGSWEAGVDGAVAGIIMLAHPRNGDFYYQEFFEGEAEDQAKVLRLNTRVVLKRDDAIDPGRFTRCLKTKEWSQLAPGHVEQKYYCPEIGLVAVDEHRGKLLRFELVDIVSE
ncbi:MAG: hypothetical protein ACREER_11505 [Alphaproteobacteria bacterium]